MSDKLQRARHIRSNPPDPTDRNAAPRNNPRANAEARIPARGRHRGVDKTLLRPPTDPGATGLIPVVGSHAGLDRTIPGATSEASIRQQKVIVAEAAEADFDLKFKEHGFPADAPIFAPDLTPDENGLVYVAKILVDAGVAGTASEARRLIDGGGVKIDQKPVAPKTYIIDPALLHSGCVLQVGKRKFVKLV